ncbi:MAG: hypothetical protein ACLU70_15295 [Lachnospira sp.]
MKQLLSAVVVMISLIDVPADDVCGKNVLRLMKVRKQAIFLTPEAHSISFMHQHHDVFQLVPLNINGAEVQAEFWRPEKDDLSDMS